MEFLSSGFNVFLIILGFGVLIFIHELGHFIAAKWAGIRTEAFAVGMGPVAIAWRKGIGFRFGSTAAAYEQRVREHIKSSGTFVKEQENQAGLPQAEMYRIGDEIGLGETEYSLRYLPLGGFVKMLGQEDANPNYVSNDPRSYTSCPVGKRMIVVSAGVIMNLLLAIVLFIVSFMIGVKFEAPVVGETSPMLPAGRALPENAAALGITKPGLEPGDLVTHIDGNPAETFADLQIASAMSKPGVPVKLAVRRSGIDQPLHFTLSPERDAGTGLLSIGVSPGSSSTLIDEDSAGLSKLLEELGLAQQGVKPGMRMTQAAGEPVQTFEQFQQRVELSNGQPVETVWTPVDDRGEPAGSSVTATIEVKPTFAVQRYPDAVTNEGRNFEIGLLGLNPLPKVVEPLDGPNKEILKKGDVILRVGSLNGPRYGDLQREVSRHPGEQLELLVLRNGQEQRVTVQVDSKGKINVYLGEAFEAPLIAEPFDRIRVPAKGEMTTATTPVANLRSELFPRTRIDAVGDVPISNWADLRRELRRQTELAHQSKQAAVVQLTTTLPMRGNQQEMVSFELSAEQVASLHELAWQTDLPSLAFEPLYITRAADGNPVKAITMGFEETKKLVVMTYLTIDRLFRRTVGVDQLRGPVGIVHIGSKVADRGMTYLIFFLAMISVNLAVINFLPMPIVDGGLFLFLVYEKFKGRPPSIAFQNAATMVGLFIIGTLFVITFYNDVLRLLS